MCPNEIPVDDLKTFEGYEINATPRNIRRVVREIRHEGAKCTKKGQSVRTVSPPRTAPKRRLSVPSDHTIGILWFVTARGGAKASAAKRELTTDL